MAEVAAIVLAAGRASRFARSAEGEDDGESKVLALLEGRPLVVHVVATASAARAAPIVVVTGRGTKRVAAALADFDVSLAHNTRYAEGMAGSIAIGLAALPDSAAAVIILLADMPRVASTTLEALVDLFSRERPDAVVPVHEGRRGNPVLVSRTLFPALRRLRGDEGARGILGGGGARVLSCVVDDPGVLVDIDTREALAALAAHR